MEILASPSRLRLLDADSTWATVSDTDWLGAPLTEIVGTADLTLGVLASSGAGAVDVQGTAAPSLDALTLIAAGAVDVVGTMAGDITMLLDASGTTGGSTTQTYTTSAEGFSRRRRSRGRR